MERIIVSTSDGGIWICVSDDEHRASVASSCYRFVTTLPAYHDSVNEKGVRYHQVPFVINL